MSSQRINGWRIDVSYWTVAGAAKVFVERAGVKVLHCFHDDDETKGVLFHIYRVGSEVVDLRSIGFKAEPFDWDEAHAFVVNAIMDGVLTAQGVNHAAVGEAAAA